MVWYSHLLKGFPQFVVIHTDTGFSVVNEAEVDVFLEFSCFFYDPTDVGNFISGFSAFSKNIMKRQKDMTLKDELPRLVDARHTIGDQRRNNCRKTEETEPKQKHPVVDVTGDGSKV